MTYEEIESLPISLDTALEVIGRFQAKANGEEFQKFEREKNILLGFIGEHEERLKMFDKVYYEYCPILKNRHILATTSKSAIK